MGKPKLLATGIRSDVQFGEAVTIMQPVNLYGCKLDDNAFVGPFVEIQANASVGKRTRVQSHAFICEGVTIGDDCFIGHGAVFINDRFKDGRPAGGDKGQWETSHIGNHVAIGSNATILPVNIVDHVCIGAGAVVTQDLLEPGIYAGNPARLIRRHI